MHNYWLGVMAVAFVGALAIWLLLVFNADRHPQAMPHESEPHREVIGGEFEARDGGRQVMPIPGEMSRPAPSAPEGASAEPRPAVPEQAEPAQAGQSAVPSQRTAPQPEHAAPSDS